MPKSSRRRPSPSSPPPPRGRDRRRAGSARRETHARARRGAAGHRRARSATRRRERLDHRRAREPRDRRDLRRGEHETGSTRFRGSPSPQPPTGAFSATGRTRVAAAARRRNWATSTPRLAAAVTATSSALFGPRCRERASRHADDERERQRRRAELGRDRQRLGEKFVYREIAPIIARPEIAVRESAVYRSGIVAKRLVELGRSGAGFPSPRDRAGARDRTGRRARRASGRRRG